VERGLEKRVLDGVNARPLAGSGCGSGRLLIFFLGGAGEGKSSSRVRVAEKFSQDGGLQTALCVLYIICCAVVVSLQSSGPSRKGVPPAILGHPGQTCAMFQASTTRLVPQRTPRSSEYDVYAHAVYVVICYMSLTCIYLLHVCHPRA
jgi:hypothetical protein